MTPENLTGEKGAGGAVKPEEGTAYDAAKHLGLGWKTNPYLYIEGGSTITLADVKGSGVIRHIWLTPTGNRRLQILRFYFDGELCAECPLGDFFADAAGSGPQISSLAVCVNPGSGYNCYFPMPFTKGFRITLENLGSEKERIYYQIDYTLEAHEEPPLYFHARFRRSNPLPALTDHVILDGVKGKGHYVGTYLFWSPKNNGWWGEGEVKFFIDGDETFPTICGTGTEDYFCGSYCFLDGGAYRSYTTPYAGMQVVRGTDVFDSQQKFGMYRWHIPDPVYFDRDLRVTVQALGWRREGRYLPLRDDISSVAYWYQTLPHSPFPPLPDVETLEII